MDGDVTDEIMTATYRALCEHGYAKLTMQDIADHSEKSKAALHYHFDTKRALLLAFLDYLYDEFTGRVTDLDPDEPPAYLTALIDTVLDPISRPDDQYPEAFGTAILELKAQAPYDAEIRRRMRAFDTFLVEHIRECLATGIDTGVFRPIDPDAVARFIVTAIDGARTKQVAVGQDLGDTRRMLHEYIESSIIAEPPRTEPPHERRPK